ncbi:protein jim lovell isoform X2 [Cryptotermes secundus]|uniref:protein jim lovell isoform X2 n=1 Tax=Cryptotermes secundus TaxID=105785 RepID=UPI000CD7C451|nr:protein jim lovell isoform X2 [Cryptotermes secundus]
MAKRNELTLDQKVRVLEALETRNQIQVASEFGISQSAVSRIKSRESDIIQRWQEMPDRKRTRRTRYSDMLDVSLVRFYESQRIAGIPVTTRMLKERATLIVDENKASGSEAGLLTSQGGSFEASDSWLSHWKHRHNLDLQRSNRSAGYFVGSKKPSAFSIISQFKELVDEEGYLVTGVYQDPDLDVQTVVTGSAPVAADTTDRGGWPFEEVPQQAPPGTKQVVAPAPVKKTLPLSSQSSPKPAITKPAPPRPVSPPQPPPPPPEVCLRWNSYHSNMQATFPSLLNNEQFVDVTLACEGRSIKCHKMMLSACSSYFEELLSQNPCQHPIVLMKDLKFWEVQALVDFMYRGEVNVGQDKLPSLLAAAEALQIKGLAGPASTSSSHDEDSLPPTLPLATDDFLDESTSSPSSARRARKRRTIASMPTPRQNTISPHRNPVGRPRLIRPSPQPSTSTYQQASVASEPPLRRARRSEPPSLPLGQEIKIEPVDIDISNDSMDPVDDGFDMNKTYDGSRGGGDANGSSKRPNDVVGGTEGGGKQEITGNLSDDNRTATSRHDSDHMDYGNNNGMNSESTVTPRGGESKTEIQDYSYTEGSTDDPGMSSSDINPTYPEVVVNPRADSASSDSILGHL